VVEVNPRYPASVEVLELATGVRALGWHRASFDPDAGPMPTFMPAAPAVAKGILYARQRLVMPEAAVAMFLSADRLGGPWFADVPPPGEVIEPGWPILTVLSQGETPYVCANSLARHAEWAKRALGLDSRPPWTRNPYERIEDPDAA
jgi:predicted ATP-grasp superfamily ATP-dependent carboligase